MQVETEDVDAEDAEDAETMQVEVGDLKEETFRK